MADKTSISIVASSKVEGFHNWPSAPKQHEFLSSCHRHIFYIKVKKTVRHTNREIEIISLVRTIRKFLLLKYGDPCNFGDRSCESIALEIVEEFGVDSCEVLEDEENGAIVERTVVK